MGANLIADGATFHIWALGCFGGSVGVNEATFSRTFSVRPWWRWEMISMSRCFKQELMLSLPHLAFCISRVYKD